MVVFDIPSFSHDENTPADQAAEEHHETTVFRATPHPHKFATDRNDCVSGAKADHSNTLDACVTDVPSPHIDRTNGTDEHVEQDEQDEEEPVVDDHVQAWENWLATLNDETAPANLRAYLAAKDERQLAKRSFEDTMEECLNGLTRAMTDELIQDTVGIVYEQQCEELEDLEGNIVTLIQSNYERRQALIQAMDRVNSLWGNQYKKLRRSILNEAASDEEEEVPGKGEQSHGLPEADGEPDWLEILEYQPTRDTVQSFLAAREQHQETNETFHLMLDGIHAGLKDDANSISSIVEDFYNNMELEFESMERDIEYHLMTNYQRRIALEARVEEAQKQSQGYFASLMSRLTGGATPAAYSTGHW